MQPSAICTALSPHQSSDWTQRAACRCRLHSGQCGCETVSKVCIATRRWTGRRSMPAATACWRRSKPSSRGFHLIQKNARRFWSRCIAREQFSLALYGTSETLKIDGEGRIVLSEALKAHAGIGSAVMFVGLGHKFRIWEPGRFRAELTEATEKVRAFKAELATRMAAGPPLR